MTNEERKALVERLRDGVLYGDARLHNPKGHDPLRMKAADQIEADGRRIAELEALTQKLMGYAGHDDECEDMTGAYPGSCTCGYSAVARAALGETK